LELVLNKKAVILRCANKLTESEQEGLLLRGVHRMEGKNGTNLYNRRAIIFLLFLYRLAVGDGLLFDQSQTFHVSRIPVGADHAHLWLWGRRSPLPDRTLSEKYRITIFLGAGIGHSIGIPHKLPFRKNLSFNLVGL
jgi:hypothetical protein